MKFWRNSNVVWPILTLIFIFASIAHADTPICSDPIGDTWDLAGSPYIVQCSIEIDAGESLTIEPGVTVKFESGTDLTVRGTLTAVGTETQPITFTSAQGTPNPGDWIGLKIMKSASGGELTWCIVEYAVDGIYSSNSLNISNCTVRNNSDTGITIYALAYDCEGTLAQPTITGCEIGYNSNYGVKYQGVGDETHGCSPSRTGSVGGTLSNSTIHNNGGPGIGIYADSGIDNRGEANPTLRGNLIHTNSGHGIIIDGSDTASPDILENQIYENTGSGIFFDTTYGITTIRDNAIVQNTGRGIYNIDDSTIIEGNQITDNQNNGIETSQLSSCTQNELHSNTPYDFYYFGDSDQIAFNNNWGTTNPSEIDNHIYDYYDNPSFGILIYEDNTPPTVSSTYPPHNATDVAVNLFITATFDKTWGMDPTTITTDTFLVNDGTTDIEGTVSYKDRTATFISTNPLEYGTIYTAIIKADVKDLAGNNMTDDYSWSFVTGPDCFDNCPGKVVESINAPGTLPKGLAYDDSGFLWNADSAHPEGTIYKIDTAGSIEDSFPSPQRTPLGLAFDGTDLWNVDNSYKRIYQINTSGAVIDSFGIQNNEPTGLAVDGNFLWHADTANDKLYKFNTAGIIITSLNSPGPYPTGVAHDGTYLWIADNAEDRIYQMDTSGNVVSFFNSEGSSPYGLAFDGKFLWNVDSSDKKIYKLLIKSYSPGSELPKISAGTYHTSVIAQNGLLWSWGSTRVYPFEEEYPVRIGSDNTWATIAAGYDFTSCIKAAGSLWGWGLNFSGQLGDGTTTDREFPVQAGADIDWLTVSSGGSHAVAIKSDRSLWAWGYNEHGELGDGTTTDRHSPTRIGSASNWITLATGSNHTLALKADGSMWSWGANQHGQLGIGSKIEQHAPIRVGTDNDWVKVFAGGFFSLAIKSNGTLWAWGANNYGQLGNGTTIGLLTPTQIGTDTNWLKAAAGSVHTVALKLNGTLWAWGHNNNGQLGIGSNIEQHTPVQVGSDDDWLAIAAGGFHTVALKEDYSYWTWGYNYNGQLGDGTFENKNSPVSISLTAPGDTDTDGDVDGADLSDFIYHYSNGDPAADLNNDGFVDAADIETFAEQFGSNNSP